MGRLSFFADEHVPNVVVTALRSNEYTVDLAKDRFGEETIDEEILETATEEGRVLLTNDRDFVEHDSSVDHVGIVIYTTQSLPPGEFVRGIDRIDRHYLPRVDAEHRRMVGSVARLTAAQ